MNRKSKFWNRSLVNLLSFAFAFAFMVIFLGSNANAQGATSGSINSNVSYSYDGKGTLTISGNGAMTDYENQQYLPWKGYLGEITKVEIKSGVTSIADWAFYQCSKLTTVSIADTVQTIGMQAFVGTKISTVTIPDSVTKIKSYAFATTPIVTVRVPNGVIEANAFWNCGNIKQVILGVGVTSIGKDAFAGCSGLAAHGYTTFEGDSKQWNTLKANIASGNDNLLQNVGYKSGCGVNGDNLNWKVEGTTLTITGSGDMKGFPVYNAPGHPLCMPWYAYKDTITKIVLEEGVTSIGQSAFREFTALTSVTIPKSIKSIGFACFADSTSLQEVDLNCDYIGESAFIRCKNLKKVTIGSNVKASGVSAFEDCTAIEEVHVKDLKSWCGIDFGGFLSTPMRASQKAKLMVDGKEVTTLTIPEGVTAISDYAFEFFPGITKVELPSSLKKVGDYAFYSDTNLTAVDMKEGVTSIGAAALTSTKLRTFTMPTTVEYIGSYAFAYAPLSSLRITKGDVGDKAFIGCGELIRVDVGKEVKSIGKQAFNNCGGLKNGDSKAGVHFEGSRAQWQALQVNVKEGNESLLENIRSYSASDVGTAITVKDTYIGKNVVFGVYKQAADGGVQNINWTVLDYNESTGTALLISRDVLDFPMYFNKLDNTPVTWETSTLRTWLNDTFYNQAFDPNSKAQIKAYTCTAEDNAEFGTKGGKDTTDNVFILSASEIEKYMPLTSSRMSACTAYAKSTSGDSALLHPVLNSSYWWVRTPGMFDYDVQYVHYTGTIMKDGMACQNIIGGVRPCIQVNAKLVSDQVKLEDKTFGGNDDPVQAFVERLYNLVLLRSADEHGMADWSNQLKTGASTGAKVAEGFFMSREMINRNVPNEEYVKICYRVMMNREADPAGLADWVDKLDSGMSRYFVLSGFTNSQEFGLICASYGITSGQIYSDQARDVNQGISAFVYRCYSEVLGRQGDEAGMNSWCQSILEAQEKKQHAENVASDGFFHSQEYLNKNSSNEEYVKTLYRTFLGRDADKDGFAYWMEQLNGGTDRDTILYGFSRSEEFAKIMAKYGIQ